MYLYLLIPTKVVKMYEYEDVFDAYDREMFERESDEDEGKREQQPDGSFIWVD